MLWFRSILPILLVLTAIRPAAAADDAQRAADMRCLAVMAKLNQLPDPRHQIGSLLGGYYYLGRVNASGAPPDLAQNVADAYSKLPAADFLAETTRCQTEMQALGKTMAGIGNAMPKVAPPANPGTPPSGGN